MHLDREEDFRSILGATKKHKKPDLLSAIKHSLFSNGPKTFYAVVLVLIKKRSGVINFPKALSTYFFKI